MSWMRLVSVALWVVAGGATYLYVLNRRLIQMRDARHKSLVIRMGGLLVVGSAAAAGYAAAGSAWGTLPAAVLVATLAGEVRRWLVRRRCRGAAPVAEENAHVRFTQPNTTTDLAVRRYALHIQGWRGPRLRIAHVSDLHVNSHLPLSYYRATMDRIAEATPDLLFFTGDFVTCQQYAGLLPGILSLAHGRLGAFTILGNHDYWADPTAVREAVTAAGITPLGDGSVRMTVGDTHAVLIAGCESPWSNQPAQLPTPADGELALLLTHTPDNIYRLSKLGYDAIFAGHYHAGQIRLPALGALVVPSNYGRRFDHGHFIINGTHLFVTAGIGSAEPPVRLWCQPDLLLVDVSG